MVIYSFKDYAYVPVWFEAKQFEISFFPFYSIVKFGLKLSPPPDIGVLIDIPSNSVLIEGEDGDKPPEDTARQGTT